MSHDIISSALVGCTLLAASVLLVAITRAKLRYSVNPVSVYFLAWFAQLFLLHLNIVDYDPISSLGWAVVAISMATFATGALIAAATIPARPHRAIWRSEALAQRVSRKRFLFSIWLIVWIGGIFFIFYIYSIHRQFGWDSFFSGISAIRIFIREQGSPPGFHYIYLWEMVLPLVTLYTSLFKREKSYRLWVIAALCTIALVFSTAKVNVIKAILWAITIKILLHLDATRAKRTVPYVALGGIFGLAIFFSYTIWSGEIKGVNAIATNVYVRFSAPIVTLDKVLHDQTIAHQYGLYLFLPISKTIAILVPGFTAPEHILPFYNVPLRFNIATYLDVAYKDFSLIGPVVIPWMLGFFSVFVYGKFVKHPGSGLWLYMASIMILWVWGTTAVASFIKPVYWFQILTGILLFRFVASSRQKLR